jgi:hypothetical protein
MTIDNKEEGKDMRFSLVQVEDQARTAAAT